MKIAPAIAATLVYLLPSEVGGFSASIVDRHNGHSVFRSCHHQLQLQKGNDDKIGARITGDNNKQLQGVFAKKIASALIGGMLMASTIFGSANGSLAADKTYDGFADYAKENKMEQSDVGCFVNKCGDQTKALFANPRGIKGVSCLGRCKGEQTCSVRCFAEFGSDALNNWLSCAIEGKFYPIVAFLRVNIKCFSNATLDLLCRGTVCQSPSIQY